MNSYFIFGVDAGIILLYFFHRGLPFRLIEVTTIAASNDGAPRSASLSRNGSRLPFRLIEVTTVAASNDGAPGVQACALYEKDIELQSAMLL